MMRFVVPGPAVPKARARAGKGGRHYTPERTRAYERSIALLAAAAKPAGWPMDARYRLTVDVTPVNRRTFDASNVLKSVEDGMNGTAYRDDRQVIDTRCRVDAPCRDAPRVVVILEVVA